MGLVLAVGGGVVGSVVDGGKVVVTLADIVTAAEVVVVVLAFSSVGVLPDTVVFIIVLWIIVEVIFSVVTATLVVGNRFMSVVDNRFIVDVMLSPFT